MLQTIDVIKKCRCDKVKSETRYVPLPDTVESLEKSRIKLMSDILDNVGYNPFGKLLNIKSIIMVMMSIGVLIAVVPNVLEKMSSSSNNATTLDSFTGIPMWILLLFPFVVITSLIFGFFRNLDDDY